MAFTFDKSDGSKTISVENGEIVETYNVDLAGINATGYAEPFASSSFWHLENFSATTAPTKQVQGQLWFDKNTDTMRAWVGTDAEDGGVGRWVQVGGIMADALEPFDDTVDIGTSASPFNTVYAENLRVTNTFSDVDNVDDLRAAKITTPLLLPNTNGSGEIGQITNKFGNGYINDLMTQTISFKRASTQDPNQFVSRLEVSETLNKTIVPLDDITLGDPTARFINIYSNKMNAVNLNATTVDATTFTGTTVNITGSANINDTTLNGVTKMSLGEGLWFEEDEDYFGERLDARIISIVDGNNSLGGFDGGLIIQGKSTADDTTEELLRIRKNEFTWKEEEIWHAGNDGPGSGLDADTLDGNHASNYYSKAEIDALLVATIAQTQNASWPVGSIYENRTDSRNPATILGFGTWTFFGEGRVTVGRDASQSEFNSAGETGGAKTVALTTANLASHTHTGPNHRHVGGSHSHSGSTAAAGAHTHSYVRAAVDISFSSGNSWGPVWNEASETAATSSAGNHTHSLSINAGGAVWSAYNGTQNTGSAGSGTAHNNLQPYIVVYRWYRTA